MLLTSQNDFMKEIFEGSVVIAFHMYYNFFCSLCNNNVHNMLA
jgi:hypothetical protein